MNNTRALLASTQAVSPELTCGNWCPFVEPARAGTFDISRTKRGQPPAAGREPRARGRKRPARAGKVRAMGTSRLETFADGVLAIAATLLILDVSVSRSPLSTQLARAWPSYVAYMVSFLTIGIIWVNHHAIMDQVARCDRTFLVVNVFFLMVVAFIPFPT